MTLQEFINYHPNVIHYERAGVEGIDFKALHERIEKSRYLKSRQSFLFFVKNYNNVLSGYYDDFKLCEKEEDKTVKCPLSEQALENLKNKLMDLDNIRLSKTKSDECKEYCGYSPSEVKNILQETLTKKFGQAFWAIDIYRKVKEFAVDCGGYYG